MTTGLVLIAAILVLGGVIATVGDRIGMRVGKARLSLFRLRPRQTATLISILTGIIISATTFGILFAVDDQLRTGVFDLQEIQTEKRQAETERDVAQTERDRVQAQRDRAQREQIAAQRRLEQINRSLRGAIIQQNQTQTQLKRTETQLNTTKTQLDRVASSFRQAQALLATVSRQATALHTEIETLEANRRQQVAERDREIAQRDKAITEREDLLKELEQQREFLTNEVRALREELLGLRGGSLAIVRNQPLAAGVVRIITPSAAPQAIDQLLREANREVLKRVLPGTIALNAQVIQITTNEVSQLVNQLKPGQDYVVRVFSAGNYVLGEPCVLARSSCVNIYATAVMNQAVFSDGEVVATASVDPLTMTETELADRINLVIAAAQFRARQAGILADLIQISDNRIETLQNFLDQIKQYNQPVDIQAIAQGITYTAGPAKFELVAMQNGQPLFSTSSR
jgi:uncharacterized protein (DUF3084 family)